MWFSLFRVSKYECLKVCITKMQWKHCQNGLVTSAHKIFSLNDEQMTVINSPSSQVVAAF